MGRSRRKRTAKMYPHERQDPSHPSSPPLGTRLTLTPVEVLLVQKDFNFLSPCGMSGKEYLLEQEMSTL